MLTGLQTLLSQETQAVTGFPRGALGTMPWYFV